ncbi:MAG: aminoacyl-tRNA hydrolase [bacterium]|nr:aminoacyl-tRNA hydrolase [bacterium]
MKPSLVIIGLGNSGKSYEKTRHNAGFWGLDTLSEAYGVGEWEDKQKFIAHIQEARIVTIPVLLVKPQTYMNLSGNCVRKIVDFFKLDPSNQVLVISDDIDLPLGDVRLREKGGPGTHNGLKSICEQIGEVYPRIRIGLGDSPAGSDLASWVLSVPSAEDMKVLNDTLAGLPEMVKEFVLGKSE